MKILNTEEMLKANLDALKQKRKKELLDIETRVIQHTCAAPPISEEQATKQMKFIDKYNFVENKHVCVLLINSSEVKKAYNRMIKNEVKTVG